MLQHALILWSFRILWLVWCHWCSFQAGVKHRSCLVRGLPATRWHEFVTCYDSGVLFEDNFHKKMWVLHGDEMDRGPSWDLEIFFCFGTKDSMQPRWGGWRFSFLEAHWLFFLPLTFSERSLLQVCERWQQVQKWAPCAQNQRWSREGWVGQLHLLKHFCRKELEDQSMLQNVFFQGALTASFRCLFPLRVGRTQRMQKGWKKPWQWLHSISLIRVKHH